MRRILVVYAALILCVVFLSALTLLYGPVNISLESFFDALLHFDTNDSYGKILWNLRVPRVVAAIFAGAALSIAGLSLQTVFQNPLAGPFVLGISSGASLGVALSMLAGFNFGHFGVLSSSALGALIVTALIMWISMRFKSNTILLVAGLLIGYFIDACVSVLISQSDGESLRAYVSWGMGSFGRLTLSGIGLFCLTVFLGIVLICCSIRYLNGVKLGESFARGLGIRVDFYKKMVLLGSSLLAASTTAYCGPVAFLGIAVPHLAYLLLKSSNHRVLIPGAALCGANISLMAGLFPEIPLNAVLSIVGVPVILWILIRSAKRENL